jgi:hypothetical protein
VVVACHEIPEGNFSNPKLEFIQVDHAPPLPADHSGMCADQRRKHLIGLNRAMEYSPSHVMFLDGDDLVSNRLAEFAAAHPTENGWYMRSGYFYCEQQPRLHLERRRFDQWCGSSHIVRPELLDFIPRHDDGLVWDHRQLARMMEEQGTPIRPLPFKGGVYRISHGENLNDYEHLLWTSRPLLQPLRRIVFQRAITPRIREEFGLYAG